MSEVVKSLPGYVYWYDREGNVLGSNQQQAKVFNASKQDIVRKSIKDFIEEKVSLENIEEINKRVLETQKIVTTEEHFKHPDGSIAVALTQKCPLRNGANEVVGIIGVSFDITESFKEKTQAETLFDTIIRLVPINIYWKNKAGYYLGCNDQQAAFFGLKSRHDIENKTPYDLWQIMDPNNPNNQQNAKAIEQADQEILTKSLHKSIEEKYVSKTGQTSYFYSQKLPLTDKRGETIGLLGLSVDITAQKQAEELRLKNTINEEKIETMKMLAASIAHEIRTPLAAIKAQATVVQALLPTLLEAYQVALAAGMIKRPLRKSQLDFLEHLPKELGQITSSANVFIDMLLTKVSFESLKEKSLQLTRLSVREVVISALHHYPLDDYSTELIKCNYKKSFAFMGDEVLFEHVIFNLLKNAIYFVRATGRPGEINIWFEQQKDRNILHFKDTGKGISKESLPNIFNSFYTHTRHGTGVGLAFCKMIIESFGGNISCDSVEDKYTHFMLSFPKVEDAQQ